MSQLPAVVSFGSAQLALVWRDGVPYLSAADLARALGYTNPRAVAGIHARHAGEFTNGMSLVLNLSTNGYGHGVATKPTRLFSPRGCHLIAMFSRTPVAAEFRRWVLDVLEAIGPLYGASRALPPPAIQPPSLTSRRWLISFDHDGREQVQSVPEGAYVLTIAQIVHALESSDWPSRLDTETLRSVTHALIDRLARRTES